MSERPADSNPRSVDKTIRDDSLSRPGGRVGAFVLRELIGSGGMGEVWRAEQQEPVRRTVAVKLIKAGMDSREILSRFEAERQALALMVHPAIAKIFDAGTTPQGRPYFAMEYVEGTSIIEYSDRRKLSTKARLRLFIRACEGVQHAHQKAILHRDLKPGNILVADVDGEPAPKIIDFGLAKAMTQRLSEHTIYTAMGKMIGTPLYMSPEQSELTGENVDTRTDVYSLGVVLYELLAGALPFDPKQLRDLGPEKFQRLVREQDPPRPSARLSTLGDESRDIAARRRLSPKQLVSQLDRELDWVVMKALEKDRNRRYESSSAFAGDIGRYLRNEPVLAGPPSLRYRLRKFVDRNRLAVAAASVVLLATLMGITGTTVGLVRALQAEKRATHEAAVANEVSNFLARLFESTNPWETQGHDLLAREVLDRASSRVETEMAGQPLLQARLLTTMGNAYEDLGIYDSAMSFHEKALHLRELERGPDHLEVASSLANLSRAIARKNPFGADKESQRGMEYQKRALQIRRRDLSPTDPLTAESLESLANFSFYLDYYSRGGDRDALPLIEEYLTEALSIHRANGTFAETAEALRLLSRVAIVGGDPDSAEKTLLQGIEDMKSAGVQGRPVLTLTLALHLAYRSQHEYAKALAVNEQVMEAGRRILKPKEQDGHALFLFPLLMSGMAADRAGQLDAAIEYFNRARSVQKRFYPDQPDLFPQKRLASVNARNGDREAGARMFAECCATTEFDESFVDDLVRDWSGHDQCPVAVPENLQALAWMLRQNQRESEALILESRAIVEQREVEAHLGH